jgi:PleD family two-component response regulator
VAERFRLAVEARAMPHGDSSVGPVVTLSVGFVSASVTAATTPAWFIKRADEGLYLSKAAGRNRVSQAVCAPA